MRRSSVAKRVVAITITLILTFLTNAAISYAARNTGGGNPGSITLRTGGEQTIPTDTPRPRTGGEQTIPTDTPRPRTGGEQTIPTDTPRP